MKKTAFALAALTGMMLTTSAGRADDTVAKPGAEQPMGWERRHHEQIREEIKLHERRAHELEPIIARDRKARHDVEENWAILERHASELHAKAASFRALAAEVGDEFGADLSKWADELDSSANHDAENAQVQHNIGGELDRVIASEQEAVRWHREHAHRMEEWLRHHSRPDWR